MPTLAHRVSVDCAGSLGFRAGIQDKPVWNSRTLPLFKTYNPLILSTAFLVHLSPRRRSLSMSDPSTYWLTFTNTALGVVVLVCYFAVAIGVIQEIVAKRKKVSAMSKLDRAANDLVNSYQPGHSFHPP